MIEVNLLCIHPKLRNKRLTPVLIQELTRQFSLLGYSEGLYIASTYLPTPILTAKYYHKIINAKILCDTGFIKLDQNTTINNVKKAHKMSDTFINENFKKMESTHLDEMYALFNVYMNRYNLHPLYTQDEFNFIFSNKLVTCYVLENEQGNVTDFISYYTTQTTVLKMNDKHKFIRKGQLYYYTSINENPFNLIKDLLIVAKNNNIDVFDALDIMENSNVIQELGFEEGTGVSHYYLYNRKIKPLKNIQCGMILC